ncbi:MAG: hypothetical protein KAI80_06195 [Hyphomicrobiaceae bacterium]|nr:hypothetical protein [Hyphomicrobiaceae bacterium]
MQWDWSSILGYLDAWRTRAERAHASVSDDSDLGAELADATPDAQGPALRHRRAWCGLSSLANPARDVAFAKSIELTGLDIIANDHSAAREPRRFDTRPTQQIVTLATMARDAGLDVHLMSWIMPHKRYIKEAADVLPELMAKTGARSLVWDAEEPWTLARERLRYSEAGALVGELFAVREFEMGATGIRYAPAAKLAPLVAVCDYMVPQCYSTRTSKADPSTVVSRGLVTWRKKFGDGPRFVPGLAAYRQSGIDGHSIRSAMQAAIDNAGEHSDTAIWWGLNSLRKSPKAAAVVASLAG